MSRSRKLINNFIFSNNDQCNYTRTISLLRRLIVKCFFLCSMLWCADKLATSISFALSFPINRKRFVFGLIYFLYSGSSTAIYDTKFKNPLDNIYSPQNLLPHLCYSHQALVSCSAKRKYTDCNCIYTQKYRFW